MATESMTNNDIFIDDNWKVRINESVNKQSAIVQEVFRRLEFRTLSNGSKLAAMELERAGVSRSSERPVTRWRREPESAAGHVFTEYPLTDRSYQKMERPTSRRGVKADITEFGISRPPTSGKAVSRPASPALNRYPTAASRMGTANSSMTRIGSALPRNFVQPNTMILDRPITQQGLVGVRPGSARAMPKLTKQMQDKLYYKQVLQMKIQELNHEITSIAGQVGGRSMETSKYQYYNGMTNDSSTEDSQDNYEEFEGAVTASVVDVEQEARALKEVNDSMEDILEKQRYAKKKLEGLGKEVEFKRKIAEKFADSMDAETRAKYEEAFRVKTELEKEIDFMQGDYDKLLNRQTLMKERIAGLPMQQEIYDLYNKMLEVEKGRGKSVEEDNSYEDDGNVDIDRAEKQIMDIEKKIADAQQELEELERDTDENQEELKYSEMQKGNDARPRTAKNKTEQLIAKLNSLEEQIIKRLERISNCVSESTDRSQLNEEDLDMFTELMDQNFENKSSKSFDELKQDYLKLCQTSSKLEVLESKIFTDKSNVAISQPDVLEVGQKFSRTDSSKDFHSESESYVQEERFEKRNYDELIEKIKINELYRFISILEDKLQKPTSEDQSSAVGKVENDDNSSLTKIIFDLTIQYNSVLINNMKLIY